MTRIREEEEVLSNFYSTTFDNNICLINDDDDNPIILVFPTLNIFVKFGPGCPLRGVEYRWGT